MEKKRGKLDPERLIFGYLSAVLYLLTVLLVIVEIVRRYIFSKSFYWSSDVVIYVFLLTAYLYIGLAGKDRVHLRVTFLPDRLKSPWTEILSIIALLVSIVYCVVFVIGTYFAVRQTMMMGLLTENRVFPVSLLYLLLGIGFGHLLVRYIIQGYRTIKSLRKSAVIKRPDDTPELVR